MGWSEVSEGFPSGLDAVQYLVRLNQALKRPWERAGESAKYLANPRPADPAASRGPRGIPNIVVCRRKPVRLWAPALTTRSIRQSCHIHHAARLTMYLSPAGPPAGLLSGHLYRPFPSTSNSRSVAALKTVTSSVSGMPAFLSIARDDLAGLGVHDALLEVILGRNRLRANREISRRSVAVFCRKLCLTMFSCFACFMTSSTSCLDFTM